MAATVELTVRDLVRKYGWEILPYVSGLAAVNALSNDQVLFVDANHTNATDADDGVHGHLPDKPLATVDYAIGLCNANAVIIVAPNHVEDYDDTTTGFDADVAGISIVGVGQGFTRPRFDFNHATSLCAIGANNVRLKNLTFRPSVAAVAIGLDVETSVTGTILEDIEFLVGEAGDGTDEFAKAIHLTSGNHDTVMRNVRGITHASCNGATHCIHVDAASDRLTFDNVVFDGPWSTGGIVEDAAGLNHVLVDCSFGTSGTNYSFNGSSTFAKRTRNLDAGAPEDSGANFIGADDSDNAVATTNVAANEVGSVLERLEQIQEATNKGTGTALAANESLVDVLSVRESAAGEADIDIDAADYTSFQALLTITPNATTPLESTEVFLDLAKATTGFVAGHTTETIQFAVARKIDGTNWRRDYGGMTTAVAANAAGLQGMKIDIGHVGPDEEVRVEVVLSAENAVDVEIPYIVYYKSNGVNAPTVTPVAAA